MTQNPYEPAPGPLQSGQPGYAGEQPYGYAPAAQPQKTNTMAILGLVFAFVFSPLGIVFSALGLSQIKKRREGGRGLALAGLILSIVFVLLGVLVLVLAAAAVEAGTQALGSTAVQAEEPLTDTEDALAGGPVDDPQGVVAACQVIVPAMITLESDVANAADAETYAQVMSTVSATIEAAGAATSDPVFAQDVQALAGDFQEAADAVLNGEDPAYLEEAMATDGEKVGSACDASGYVE